MRICLTLTGIFFLQAAAAQHAPAQEKPAVTKWEYGMLRVPSGFKDGSHEYAWVTEKEDVTADSWKAFAEKMKFENKEEDAKPDKARIVLLNQFGARGWELVSGNEPAQRRFTFKRRLP